MQNSYIRRKEGTNKQRMFYKHWREKLLLKNSNKTELEARTRK